MNEEKYYELKQQIEKYRNLFFKAQTVEDKEKYISKLEKAKQLLNKYIQEFGEPDIITNPNIDELTQEKAMKLLFYMQAASLVIRDKRLFKNNIVAGKNGPYIEEIRNKYGDNQKILGQPGQDLKAVRDYKEIEAKGTIEAIVSSIYYIYGRSSTFDIQLNIEKEDPWQETAFNQTFSDERLKNYYKNVFLIVED